MKIQLSDQVALKLMTIGNICEGLEFSGFGFVEVKEDTIFVYDTVVLDIGNEVFTVIEPSALISLMEKQDARNMKLWIHRHGIGNGILGSHNWSEIDEQTITEAPLGGHPEMVKWSCSMVLTPKGWVGRIDNHLKNLTKHIEVIPQCADAYEIYKQIIARKPRAYRESQNLTTENDFWGDGYSEFEDLVKRRFNNELLNEKGLSLNEMTTLLLDSYYEDDDDLVCSFLDPKVTDEQIFRLITKRNQNGPHSPY